MFPRSLALRFFTVPSLQHVTLIALGLVLLWDASGLDLWAAGWFGTSSGFAWRESTALIFWMHEVPRVISWILIAALFLAIAWPQWIFKRIDRGERTQLAFTVLLSVAVVSTIKLTSHTSCPYDVQQFGGVAGYISHWAWWSRDGGPGHCFPAGHASAAFAYVAGYFAYRRASPSIARIWVVSAFIAGLVLGWSQQMRGAHYLSHTLWTAWICWAVAYAIEVGTRRRRRHHRRYLLDPTSSPEPPAIPSSANLRIGCGTSGACRTTASFRPL